ncbi:MAG: FKBP-type peptidyl-prolyl cis-trans isomerase [Lentisphaerae bacterium]|nr:FKBP-type peptidyl-prolyl cis-trans isomerase [Lentisphaerota bacterium]
MAADSAVDTPGRRQSYALGMDMAKNLKAQGIELDVEAFSAGIKAALSGGEALLSEGDVQKEIMDLQSQLRANMMKKQEEAAARGPANKEAGQKFLAENKGKEGVTETATGLQYKVLKPAEGAKPAATDTVKVHYTGKLLNGEVFDSSEERGEPVSFRLDQVIPGWTEGVQLMPVGSRYQFWIPSDLAYGERGAGGKIEPGSTLTFEVELLAIEK